jgi:transcriptional regulator with XRE-family HTH domain
MGMEFTMNPTHSKMSNTHIRLERETRGWSQEDLAEKIGTSQKVVSRWERGESTPLPYYRQKLCKLFGRNAAELGFLDEQSSEDHPVAESAANDTFHGNLHLSMFDLGVIDKLDSAESIINLAWEAWFASRPSVAARSVNTLLPGLEKIAYSPYLPGQTLRAKHLVIRAHGLLGSICLDASQNDTALFHYMQAHRFAEEIHDGDLAATYLCLMGDVLILNCVLIYNTKMREQGHGTDEIRIGSQGIEPETQLLLNRIKGGKDAIGEILLTQLVPQMLHRIHLRTVGGLKEQADVFGNLQIRRTMPARLIDLHDDEGICKRLRDVLKKQVHHGCIGVRKQERHHCAQLRSQSRESIHGLTNGLLRSVRAHPRRSPASLGFTHTSESGFILDHQNEGAVVIWLSLVKDLRDLRRIVFLKCS